MPSSNLNQHTVKWMQVLLCIQLFLSFFSRKQNLYCCFVDYQKAFDSIDHLKLWRRLVKHGVRGNLLNVIKCMYRQIKSCMKFHGQYSDFYTCYKGLVRGGLVTINYFTLCKWYRNWPTTEQYSAIRYKRTKYSFINVRRWHGPYSGKRWDVAKTFSWIINMDRGLCV